ncbi:unnamed protein product, partial [Linum tenue]
RTIDEIELQRQHFKRLIVEVEERGPEAVRQARDALFYGLRPAEDNVREPKMNETTRGRPQTITSRIHSYCERSNRSRSRSGGPRSSGGRSSGGRSRSTGGRSRSTGGRSRSTGVESDEHDTYYSSQSTKGQIFLHFH